MSENDYTRRRVLQQLGTTSMAAVSAVAGCLDSDESNPAETPESTSDSTQDNTPEPETSNPDADAWMEYGPKPYALFSPHPDEINSATSYLTSTLPAVALRHSDAFGEAENRVRSSWISIPPGGSVESTYLNVQTYSTRCIGGDFDKEPVAERFENLLFDKYDTYRGFDLYAQTSGGAMLQMNAVRDGWVLITFPSDIPEGEQMVQHLIDLIHRDATPHYRSGEPFTDIVQHLPQGVFTRVYPDVSVLSQRILRDQLVTAGETLRFDGRHEPATGVMVLRFSNDVDDPRRVLEESSGSLTSFLTFSPQAQESEIRVSSDRTLVLEKPVDPETVFDD